MTAPIVWHHTRSVIVGPGLHALVGLYDEGEKFQRRVSTIPGELWEREVARDVQAHGEPRPFVNDPWAAKVAKWPRTARTYVRGQIERRRPAMRATRAEALDGLSTNL